MNINSISKITFEAKNSKINNKRKTNLLTQRHNCDSVELSKKEQPKFLKQAKFVCKMALVGIAALTTTGCSQHENVSIVQAHKDKKDDNEFPDKYEIQKGDSLWQISQNLYDNSLSAKQTQIVVEVISKNNQIDDKGNINVGQTLDLTSLKNDATKALIKGEDYKVQKNDSLWQIVRNIYGDNLSNQEMQSCVNKIIKGNELDESGALNVGQKINLSCLFEENKEQNQEIHFRYGQPINLNYPTQKAQNIAQTLYEKSQLNAIQTSRPRTAPTIDANGKIIANEQFYKATKEGPLSGYTVMVNSGHGGYNPETTIFDPGAINEDLKLEEWSIAIDYAERLTEKLLAQGADVLLTQGQIYTLADSISNFSKTYGIEDNKNLKLISLHCNANLDRNIKGTMFYYTDVNDTDGNCEDLPNSLHQIAQDKGINMRDNINSNLLVCRTANNLGIENTLVELGFITNQEDAELMTNNPQFKEDILNSIVEGLIDNIA